MSKKLHENEPQNPNQFLGWITTMLDLINKYGVWKILKSIFLIALCVIVFYAVFNPTVVFDKINAISTAAHTRKIEYRMKNEYGIRLELKELLYEVDADRAFLLEIHNGTNNPSGLPFLFCSMNYEEVKKGVEHIDNDYKNIQITRYPFITYLYSETLWFGNMDEMEPIDARLSYKMRGNGAKYLVTILIEGQNETLGLLGITYTEIDENFDIKKVRKAVSKASQKFAIYLDANNIK